MELTNSKHFNSTTVSKLYRVGNPTASSTIHTIKYSWDINIQQFCDVVYGDNITKKITAGLYPCVHIKEILQYGDMLSSPHVRTLRPKKKKRFKKETVWLFMF